MNTNNLYKLNKVIESLWDEYAEDGSLWIKEVLNTLLEIRWDEVKRAEEISKN